ncbi:MAG: hypothetical protein NW208_11250 [Bryobacter sp.]|nr:hypothetical protein [Bryobacter sp.]
MKLLTFFLLAASMFAQEPVTRVFEFILDDGEKMQKLSALFAHKLARIQVEPALGLVVMTGSEAQVTEVEALLKKYYKPKALEAGISGPPNRNIELVTQILYARSEGSDSTYPATLQPIVQQLKQLTLLNSFNVVETQVVQLRNGTNFELRGTMQLPGIPESAATSYGYSGAMRISGTKIQGDKIRFSGRVPYRVGEGQYQFMEVALVTSFDLKPGQSTVIGKTNASTKDGSIILILTARLVD